MDTLKQPVKNSDARDSRTTHFLTIDLEEYWRGYASRGFRCEKDSHKDVAIAHWLLEMLAQHQVQATFFIVSEFAIKEPSLIRKIADASHEIASHSHAHLPLNQHDVKSFHQDTKTSKECLQDISGCKVVGYRAPLWSLTPNH